MSATHQRNPVSIEADPTLPIIRISRDFDATPAQLMRAHTDPELFARWVGPDGSDIKIIDWDATTGGRWRYVGWLGGNEFAFHGCFHEVGETHLVQTFTYDDQPDDVALETLRFEDLGDGRTRLHAQSLVDSFESRDQWLASGMETGVDQGYAKLDDLVGELAEQRGRRAPAHRRPLAPPDRMGGTGWRGGLHDRRRRDSRHATGHDGQIERLEDARPRPLVVHPVDVQGDGRAAADVANVVDLVLRRAIAVLEHGRWEGMQHLARRLRDGGLLRAGVTLKEAAETLWVLSSFDAFDQLFTGRRLSPPVVARRLLAMAERTLLDVPHKAP